MRLKILTNLGSNDYPPDKCYKAGEEVDESEQFAMKLVASGHAVELPPQPVKADAPATIIADQSVTETQEPAPKKPKASSK